jgi:hypothetical protein
VGTHLQLVLIGSVAQFGGGFAGDEASAEKPFAALLDVVGVRVSDGSVQELLFRALAQGDRSCQPAHQNKSDERKDTK